jgi:hypothetical protein
MPSMVSSMGSTWMRLPYLTSVHYSVKFSGKQQQEEREQQVEEQEQGAGGGGGGSRRGRRKCQGVRAQGAGVC